MKRKLISILLVLCMVVTLLPTASLSMNAVAASSGSFTYELDEDDQAIITGYEGSATALTIPASLDGYPVAAIGGEALKGNAQIRSVTFPETLKRIEDQAFAECPSLAEIHFPQSLTRLGEQAFINCDSLTGVTLPSALEFLGGQAFGKCDRLSSVFIPKTITECTTSYAWDGTDYFGPFNLCGNLTSVTFADGIKEIPENLFFGCNGLKAITIPDTVITIGNSAFRSSGLKSIQIPALVTTIGEYAFGNCADLAEVTFPDQLNHISELAFVNCDALTGVVLPVRLEYLGGQAFGKCDGLKSVFIPKTIQECTTAYDWDGTGYFGPFNLCGALTDVTFATGITEIPQNLFYGCSGLPEITIPKTVTTIKDSAFRETGLKKVVFQSGLVSIETYAFARSKDLAEVHFPTTLTELHDMAFLGCDSLVSVELPSRLRLLGGQAFGKCENLTSVTIPKSINEVGSAYDWDGTGYYGPFNLCPSLSDVTFETGVTTIYAGMFERSGLKEITLPDSITEIQYHAFAECKQLEQVQFPSKLEKLGSGAFWECRSLQEAILPDTIAEPDTCIFEACSSLKKVKLPKGWTGIGEKTFFNCESLTDITLPEAPEWISYHAFRNCAALETLKLPASVRDIYAHAFRDCASLKTVALNEGLNWIGDEAFSGCKSLESLALPNSLESMGSSVFANCENLSDLRIGFALSKIPSRSFFQCYALDEVLIPANVTKIEGQAFANCVALKKATIHPNVTEIASDAFSYPDDLTICGSAGSTAETYANEIGATFVSAEKPIQSIRLNQTALNMKTDEIFWLVPEIDPADHTDTLVWKSSNTDVAEVDAHGKVTANGGGTANITLVGGSAKAVCKVTVIQPVERIWIEDELTLSAGEQYTLEPTIRPDDANNKAVAWSSSNASVASVTKDGVVTGLKKGTAVITCAAQDGSGVKSTCTVTVVNSIYHVTDVADLQSPHNYPNNCSDIWEYTDPGKAFLKVTFSANTSVEEDSDYILIYDKNDEEIGSYTGTELAGKTITVSGDTVRIKLVSDEAYSEYGFAVTKVSSDPALSIQTQPKSATVTAGGTATFTVKAEGSGLTYQWQYRTSASGEWKNSTTTGAKTATLSIKGETYRNGYQYRCVVTDASGDSVTSNAATLTVKSPLTITAQPKSASVASGATATFTVTAEGTGLSYQWQYKTAGGTAWNNSSSATTGYNTATLKVVGEARRNGYQYRCVVTDASGATVTSNAATLTVKLPAPTLTVTLNAKGQPYLTWTAVSGAAKYEVWRATSSNGTYTKLSTTTGKSLTNSSAAAGSTYYYKVRALDANGAAGVYSAVKSAKASLAAPTLTVTLNAKGQPYLTWTAVTGAAKYEIWRSTSSGGTYTKLSTTTGKSLTNSSAAAGTTYFYKVRAVDANGNAGAFSAVKSVKASLAAPTLTVKLNAKGQPYLTWTAVTGAAKYEVWRATSENGTYSKLSTTTGKSLTNSSAAVGTTYFYKVRALTSDGAAGVYSAVKSAKASTAAPTLTVKLNAKGQPYLTWTAVTGAAKYEIWRSTSESGTYTKLSTTTGKSLTNSSAKVGTTYYYKVRAIASDGAVGPFSAVKSIRVRLAAPTLTVKLNAKGQPYLTWTAVTGAAKYEIWRAASENGTYTKLSTTTGKSLTNSSAASGVTYYYKVRAVGADGYVGVFSTVKSVTAK